MKLNQFILLGGLLTLGFTACSDDNAVLPPGEDNPYIPPTSEDVTLPEGQTCFVVTQGSQGYGISGEIDGLNTVKHTSASDLFFKKNQVGLGETPQAPVRYGSRIYVPVFESNCVWVLDAATLRAEKQIATNAPEAVCGGEGYVVVANNDGFVTRIDTLDLSVSEPLAVGPNPAGVAITRGKAYVSISDGYNWANNYANGKQVVAVDVKNWTKAATYSVPLNPGAVEADEAGRVYVLCRGNYGDVPMTVERLTDDLSSETLVTGASLLMKMNKSVLWFLDTVTDWTTNVSETKLYTLDCLTDRVSERALLPADEDAEDAAWFPVSPTFLEVNPRSGALFIGSLQSAYGYANPGFVYEYNSEGLFQFRYSVGVMPFGMVFK